MRLSTECCGSPAIVVGEPEGVGSVKVEVGDALSSVMGERDFRLDMFVAVACEKLEKSATIVVIAIASAVTVREKAHDVCVRGSTTLDTSVDISDNGSCCLVVEGVKNAVPGMESLVALCFTAVADTVRLEMLPRVLCCDLMTLTGSCRLVEGVLCNEMMAEDMLVDSWTSETCDGSVFTHAVEDIGLFAVDLASETIDSSLTVDDVRMKEAVPDEPGDV